MNNIPDDITDNEKSDNASDANLTKGTISSQDIHDSPQDEEQMKQEGFTLDLPDVSDIPGQEHVQVPQLNQFADTTIASDDEEGEGLFKDNGDEEDTDLVMGNDADVDPADKKALRIASEDIITNDNTLLREASLDNRDNEGDLLNEGSSGTKISGKDLDIAGADEDDSDEEIGEEDEENNDYSLGGDDNDEPKTDEF
jgi:hypothetical protein